MNTNTNFNRINDAMEMLIKWSYDNSEMLNKYLIVAGMDNCVNSEHRTKLATLGGWLSCIAADQITHANMYGYFDTRALIGNITSHCTIHEAGTFRLVFPSDSGYARQLIGLTESTGLYVATALTTAVANPTYRSDLRKVQSALLDVIGMVTGNAPQPILVPGKDEIVPAQEAEKPVYDEAINTPEAPNKTLAPEQKEEDEIDMAKIDEICRVLYKVYDDHSTMDQMWDDYFISTDEFEGTAGAWLDWICRSPITVDGDDHLCQKVVNRLSAPMKIMDNDQTMYWPGILCGDDPEPLVVFETDENDELRGCVINSHIARVDVDHWQAISMIGECVAKIVSKIIGIQNSEPNQLKEQQ